HQQEKHEPAERIGKSGTAARENFPSSPYKQYRDTESQWYVEVELTLAQAMPGRAKVVTPTVQLYGDGKSEIHTAEEGGIFCFECRHAEIFGETQHHGVAETEPRHGDFGHYPVLGKLAPRLYHIL